MPNPRRKRPLKENIKTSPTKKQPQAHHKSHEPDLKGMGLSSSLMTLLGIALQDGFAGQATFSLLKDIYPYVSPHDRHAIEHALRYRNVADTLTTTHAGSEHIRPYHSKRVLGSKEKFSSLLQTLGRYSGQKAKRTFSQLERYVRLQEKMSRLQKDGFSMANLPDIIGLFTTADHPDASHAADDIARATSMMQMMQNMGSGNGGGNGNMDMASMMSMLSSMNAMGGGNNSNGNNSGGVDPSMLMQMMQMMQNK